MDEIEAKIAQAEEDCRIAREAFKKSKHTKTGLHSERATEIYAAALNRLAKLRADCAKAA